MPELSTYLFTEKTDLLEKDLTACCAVLDILDLVCTTDTCMIDIRHGSSGYDPRTSIPCKNEFSLVRHAHPCVSQWRFAFFFKSYIPARLSQYSDVRTFAKA